MKRIFGLLLVISVAGTATGRITNQSGANNNLTLKSAPLAAHSRADDSSIACQLTPHISSRASCTTPAQTKPEKSIASAKVTALINRGLELRRDDKPLLALRIFAEAISVAPDNLRAHSEYVRTKAYDLDRFDEVKTEYENMMKQAPENPVYPMALATGQSLTPESAKRTWYEIVAKLSPVSAWGHLAKAFLTYEKEPASALIEIRQALERDSTLRDAYWLGVIIAEAKLKDLDGALSIARQWADHPDTFDFRGSGLVDVWRLELLKEKESAEAKARLGLELSKLISASHDLNVLISVRSAYSMLLKDTAGAAAVEDAILRIDPHWYTNKGSEFYFAFSNESGVAREVVAVNREVTVMKEVFDLDDQPLPGRDRVLALRALLFKSHSSRIRLLLLQRLFRAASRDSNAALMVEFGERYLEQFQRIYPNEIDAALLAKIAVARADQSRVRALNDAQRAVRLTAVRMPWTKPKNTDEHWFEHYDEQSRRSAYEQTRALALDAMGWTLCVATCCKEGEAFIRQAIGIRRTQKSLLHLAATLEKLGHHSEAMEVSTEAGREWLESLKRQLQKEASQDFVLASLDGRPIRLSGLKGKVVLVNFWATWCSPCAQEMPLLERLYEKYKTQGLEILAISVDEQVAHYKVPEFVKDHSLTFPVLYDNGVQSLYGVTSFPTSLLIDREGLVRLRFGIAEEKSLDALISELLK